jgi:hypothetical protein
MACGRNALSWCEANQTSFAAYSSVITVEDSGHDHCVIERGVNFLNGRATHGNQKITEAIVQCSVGAIEPEGDAWRVAKETESNGKGIGQA